MPSDLTITLDDALTTKANRVKLFRQAVRQARQSGDERTKQFYERHLVKEEADLELLRNTKKRASRT